jgi:hypothetical protein
MVIENKKRCLLLYRTAWNRSSSRNLRIRIADDIRNKRPNQSILNTKVQTKQS